MICGLKNLHERKIVHRDIKCANLFIDKTGNGEVLKLGDMNVSKVAKEGMLLT
jgi:NIMA (never in mitosis gene a)-related kinase